MTEQENLEKKIKRNIYGKPQSILVIFPPGLSGIARDEAEYILENLWFQNKFKSEITVLKNSIRIDQIHMFAVIELLMRGQCFTDIRLIVSEGKAANMPAFEKRCEELPWEFYLTRAMSLRMKVDVGVSPYLHEGAMKELLTQGLRRKVSEIVAGENAEETTTLYVDVYKYHSIMSISLAGAPLYKRGFRSVLSNSAPLREDIAACCIQQAVGFGMENNKEFELDSLFVPFSGTGTFLFEYWMTCYQFAPVLFERTYAVQEMPLFRSDNFNYLLKKAREHCLIGKLTPANYYCVDNAESANEALLKNIESFKLAVEKNQLDWNGTEESKWAHDDDFLKMDIAAALADLPGNIFMPINPPYGLRFGKSNDTVTLYKQIALQVNALAGLLKKRKNHVTGFVLCPSEESWSSFCKTLSGAAIDTYHLTQGGLDIRVAQFYI